MHFGDLRLGSALSLVGRTGYISVWWRGGNGEWERAKDTLLGSSISSTETSVLLGEVGRVS